MARKRSATFATASSRRQKSRKTTKSDISGDSPPPPFLRLPAELRNHIYALVCGGEDDKAYLTFRSRGDLAHAGSGLARVSRQVRNEFLPVLSSSVPIIDAQVKDFDFAHIVTFFNRCTEPELRKLPTVDASEGSERIMRITVYVTDNAKYGLLSLRRWINRIGNPEKKGTDLKLEYCALTRHSMEPKDITEKLLLMKLDYEDENQLRVLSDLADQLSKPVKFRARVNTRPPQALTFF